MSQELLWALCPLYPLWQKGWKGTRNALSADRDRKRSPTANGAQRSSKAWHDTPHAWHAWTLWQLCDGDAWSPGECAGEASDTREASGSTTRSVALLRQGSPPKGITAVL